MLLALALTVSALGVAQSPAVTIRAGTVLDGRGGVTRNTTIERCGAWCS